MITSTKNPKVQSVRALQARARTRREQGAFVVEGTRLCEEVLKVRWKPQLVLYGAELDERAQRALEGFREMQVECVQVSSHVMRAASDTQTPQGLLAVLPMDSIPLPEDFDFVLVADRIGDPGNLGTMLRAALSAGVDAVLLAPQGVDPYSPKVIRAAMGAHFRLPVHPCSWAQIGAHLHGLRVYLAEARAGTAYTEADLRSPLALIVGGEAHGPSAQARRLADGTVHIPMPGGGESLNAAVAAAVLMFEVARQREVQHA
ncbi:MAG: RNA methyltransferase [Anaerolineales bacterium]|jgi:TrmH family RNA methyltransferase